VLGTQNVLGTPREPFSHLLYEMLFVYEIFIVQTWIEGMRKECTSFIIFVFERMNPLPTYLSMEGKDQNAVVRIKDFQK
jgi:hypothetical protein